MRLKRLILQGFKSFKDRTTIHFDDGITGIVGPNGCGKSNIVDALFWVMGEQSAKHLRGNTMKDVIFAGSQKHKPGAWAEVSLVLENDDGKHIHIGNKVVAPHEIQLTRKLYRNSDTEYRINGEPCRLKDIQEVFMDTGAGAKSYAIIAQGEINRLVQAKPQERRAMIEDVAGVTKFKHRRKESVRKMEETRRNLERLSDLRSEIEKTLRKLASESEKAQRAISLKERLERYDLITSSHKEFDLLLNIKGLQESVDEANIQLSEWRERKVELESSLEEERVKRTDWTKALDILQKEFNAKSSEFAASEERLKHLKRSRDERGVRLKEKEGELEQLTAELLERKEKLETLLEELSKFTGETQDYTELKGKVDESEKVVKELNLKSSEKDSLISGLNIEIQNFEKRKFREETRLSEFSNKLTDIVDEVEKLEKELAPSAQEQSDLLSQIEEYEKALDLTNTQLEEQRASKNEAQQRQRVLEENLKAKELELSKKDSKLKTLMSLNESFSHLEKGSAQFLEGQKEKGFKLFGQMVESEAEFAKATQAAMELHLSSIFCPESAKESLFSEVAKDLSAHFLLEAVEQPESWSEEQKERLALILGEYSQLSEHITLKEEALGLKGIFERCVVVEDFSHENLHIPASFVDITIVSKDGKKVLSSRSGARKLTLTGKVSAGVVERNNEIKILEEEIKVLTSEVESQKSDLEKTQELVQAQREQVNSLEETKFETKGKFQEAKVRRDSLIKGSENLQRRLETLQKRKAQLSSEKLSILEGQEEFEKSFKQARADLAALMASKGQLESDIEKAKASYDEQRQKWLELEAQSKSAKERHDGLLDQRSDFENQIERGNSRKTSLAQTIEQENSKSEEESLEIESLVTGNSEVKEEISKRQVELKEKKKELELLQKQMKSREDELKKLTNNISKNEKDNSTRLVKLERAIEDEQFVVKDSFEKYQVNLRSSLHHFLEWGEKELPTMESLNSLEDILFEEVTLEEVDEEGAAKVSRRALEVKDFQFVRKYGQDLKDYEFKFKKTKSDLARLGQINWQAVEDHKQQKLRFDFLKEQEGELSKSLEDLETAINKIDMKSKERFKNAFEEVDMRFRKVFPIIFGGGSAHLRVTGSFEDPECGVDIVAQPPGKKMQNINLMSGGEKALTAVSLIFSVFLVKPSPFCLLDEVDAPLDDANVGRFNELLREMSHESQFILVTHNKKTMELNDTLYGVTMQEPGVSSAVSVELH